MTASPTIANIKAGEIVLAGYKSFKDENTFLGFTDLTERYSERIAFSSLKEVYAATGAGSLSGLEAHEKANGAAYGHRFGAVFKSVDGDTWTAYLHNGRYSVGSSADALKLARI
jgi:hypothetical protein